MTYTTLNAFLSSKVQSESFLKRERLTRGISKIAMVPRSVKKEKVTNYIEMMTAETAYQQGYLDEDELDSLDPTTIIPVKLRKVEVSYEEVPEHRFLPRDSMRKTRRTTKNEELVDATRKHPLMPTPHVNAVNKKIQHFNENPITNHRPYGLVFLKNISGEAHVRESYLVKDWQQDHATLEDQDGTLHTMTFDKGVVKSGVMRDTILYLPSSVLVC